MSDEGMRWEHISLVCRTRCSVLRAAPQSRGPYRIKCTGTVIAYLALSDGQRVCDAFELLSYLRRKSRRRRADTADLASALEIMGTMQGDVLGRVPTEEEQRNPQLGRVLLRRAIAYGIFLRLAFRPVVPANAGTHTARILVSALEQRPFSIFEARGDGVPAFAGTTR